MGFLITFPYMYYLFWSYPLSCSLASFHSCWSLSFPTQYLLLPRLVFDRTLNSIRVERRDCHRSVGHWLWLHPWRNVCPVPGDLELSINPRKGWGLVSPSPPNCQLYQAQEGAGPREPHPLSSVHFVSEKPVHQTDSFLTYIIHALVSLSYWIDFIFKIVVKHSMQSTVPAVLSVLTIAKCIHDSRINAHFPELSHHLHYTPHALPPGPDLCLSDFTCGTLGPGQEPRNCLFGWISFDQPGSPLPSSNRRTASVGGQGWDRASECTLFRKAPLYWTSPWPNIRSSFLGSGEGGWDIMDLEVISTPGKFTVHYQRVRGYTFLKAQHHDVSGRWLRG